MPIDVVEAGNRFKRCSLKSRERNACAHAARAPWQSHSHSGLSGTWELARRPRKATQQRSEPGLPFTDTPDSPLVALRAGWEERRVPAFFDEIVRFPKPTFIDQKTGQAGFASFREPMPSSTGQTAGWLPPCPFGLSPLATSKEPPSPQRKHPTLSPPEPTAVFLSSSSVPSVLSHVTTPA